MTVSSVWLWANGNVMVFDDAGEQLPALQGPSTPELLEQIRSESTPATGWFGFGEDGPLTWPAPPPRLRSAP